MTALHARSTLKGSYRRGYETSLRACVIVPLPQCLVGSAVTKHHRHRPQQGGREQSTSALPGDFHCGQLVSRTAGNTWLCYCSCPLAAGGYHTGTVLWDSHRRHPAGTTQALSCGATHRRHQVGSTQVLSPAHSLQTPGGSHAGALPCPLTADTWRVPRRCSPLPARCRHLLGTTQVLSPARSLQIPGGYHTGALPCPLTADTRWVLRRCSPLPARCRHPVGPMQVLSPARSLQTPRGYHAGVLPCLLAADTSRPPRKLESWARSPTPRCTV
ncbi:uncharacterized protein LOC127034471 [Gopherus flavomarginatus]|uniref:uncharacterized protein LOC127034471 n=1 Tax=Gopherus flavomarginatus TaxID=286002 RepID=UPI0021CBC2D9|nr:uncharacterized protein LOC127034471 [Gopherus flavomarginatus]